MYTTECTLQCELCVFIFTDAGIHIFRGTQRGNFPLNNGLVVSENPASNDFRFRFFCRSDSMLENVGKFIGLDGNTSLTSTRFFDIDHRQPGELSVENKAGSENALTADQEGIYTCLIPLQDGKIRVINIGIYRFGFSSELILPLIL